MAHHRRPNPLSTQALRTPILILLGLFSLALLGCRAEAHLTTATPPPPSATATRVPPTSTAPPSLTPSQTLTSSPTLTATPTETLTPTPKPIIQSEPVIIELSGGSHEGRPQLSGTVRYVDTEHFRIFYTFSGEDAVLVEDTNGNAIPDYVDEVAATLEHTWSVEVDELGWSPPPPDGHMGGGELYDVYLEDLDLSIAGYVNGGRKSQWVGDNPNSALKEGTASYSYMGLDNDFAEVDEAPGIAISRLEYMRTTIAHEFNHALQFGLDGQEPHRWLWESTATWAETYVYGEIKDTNFHLRAAFKSPDTCLLDRGGHDRVEDAGHWYAKWLFLRHMSEKYGPEVVASIWKAAIRLDGYDAVDKALVSRLSTFEGAYQDYTIALLLRTFKFDLDYPTVRLEGQINGYDSFAPTDGVGQMGADFIEIETEGIEGSLEISLWNLQDGIVVGIDNYNADVYHIQDGTITVDAGQYQHLYLIVLNLERVEDPDDCQMRPYRVVVLEGQDPAAPDESIHIGLFKKPTVEALLDPDEFDG